MKENNWKDAEIEELLREMPSMKDSRSKEELYRAIQKRRPDRKKWSWGYPALAGVAALMILVLITPSLYNSFNQDGFDNSAGDMATQDSAADGASNSEIAALPESTEESAKFAGEASESDDQTIMMTKESAERTNVYQEDLQNHDLLTFGLVTTDAVSVPVSVLAEKRDSVPWLERFTEVSGMLPEDQWGFDDYYPLAGTLKVNEKEELVYTVSDNEMNNLSSAGEKLLMETLISSLGASDFTKVLLQSEDGGIPSFSHMGKTAEVNRVTAMKRGYYSYTLENGETYLVPGENSYGSVSEALTAMKASPNSFFAPVIRENVEAKVSEEGSLLSIDFEGGLLLSDPESDLLLIEGLLLTAKEFGFEQVTFLNIENPLWNGFDFSQPVPVPVSPNKKILN